MVKSVSFDTPDLQQAILFKFVDNMLKIILWQYMKCVTLKIHKKQLQCNPVGKKFFIVLGLDKTGVIFSVDKRLYSTTLE